VMCTVFLFSSFHKFLHISLIFISAADAGELLLLMRY